MKTIEYIDPSYKGEKTLKRNIAKVIFYDGEGKYLLQDRKSVSKSGEEWGLFGGGIDNGESAKEAIVRELKEEIADLPSDLRIKFFTKDHTLYFSKPQNSYRELFEVVFVCKLPVGLKVKVLEGGGARWFDLESARKLKFIPGNFETIERFASFFRKFAGDKSGI